MDHFKILQIAEKQAKNPSDVPKIETLHQNIAHMTVALKEVETRLLRVTNKMNRLKIENRMEYTIPLAECVAMLKTSITHTEKTLREFEG